MAVASCMYFYSIKFAILRRLIISNEALAIKKNEIKLLFVLERQNFSIKVDLVKEKHSGQIKDFEAPKLSCKIDLITKRSLCIAREMRVSK